MPSQERVHMLSKFCWWIVAFAAFICLAPLLAFAVSVHSDIGIRLGRNITKIFIAPMMSS
jgi:hypothetical protein